MLLAILFALGTANFAINKAVIESEHPLLDTLPTFLRAAGGRATLGFEFIVLLAAMMFAAHGWTTAAWAYVLYSALNGIMAWIVLNHRF